MPSVTDEPLRGRARIIGLLKALGGAALSYALWPLGLIELLGRLMDAPQHSVSGRLGEILLAAMIVPVVLCFIGLWELVSGRPLRLLESSWGRLGEWQQGVLSFLLLCLALGVFLLVLHFAFGVELF